MQNLGEDGTFRSPEALANRLARGIGGASPKEIVYLTAFRRDGLSELPRSEAARAFRGARLYPRFVERVVERPGATGGTVAARRKEKRRPRDVWPALREDAVSMI